MESDSTHLECITIEIQGNRDNILLTSCYRAPNINQKEFLEAYRHLVEEQKMYSKNLIIGLDHNMDLLKSNVQNLTHQFFELNLSNVLFPCITKLTSVTHSIATLIDNIFCSQPVYRNSNSSIIIDDISDHMPCYCVVEGFTPTIMENTIVYKRRVNDTTISNLREDLKVCNWSKVLSKTSVNEQFKLFHDTLSNAMDKAMPLRARKIKPKKNDEPWITKGMQCSIKKLKKYRSLYYN